MNFTGFKTLTIISVYLIPKTTITSQKLGHIKIHVWSDLGANHGLKKNPASRWQRLKAIGWGVLAKAHFTYKPDPCVHVWRLGMFFLVRREIYAGESSGIEAGTSGRCSVHGRLRLPKDRLSGRDQQIYEGPLMKGVRSSDYLPTSGTV